MNKPTRDTTADDLPSGDRVDIALDAAAQLEGLFVSLLDLAMRHNINDDDAWLGAPILRAVSVRGRELTRATYGALSDSVAKAADLRRVVDHV